MFTVEERAQVRDQLLARAQADGAIAGAAFTGSAGAGQGDRWSDTDLVLAVRGDLGPVASDWTRWLYDELGAQHHWDFSPEPRLIRVFLLPGWIEIDLTFVSQAEFGPRGPQWQTIFGQAQPLAPFQAPDPQHLAGLVWHHALHARIFIERGRWWQAEYWISAMRNQVIALACLRLGHPVTHVRGAHLLPGDLATRLQAGLVRSLDEAELRRALSAMVSVAAHALEASDPGLAGILPGVVRQLIKMCRWAGEPARAAASRVRPA